MWQVLGLAAYNRGGRLSFGRAGNAAWDPYGNGLWAWYPGAGYTWVSPYPWGWMPYHSGSWSYCPTRGWGWQPGSNWQGIQNIEVAPPQRPLSPGKFPSEFPGRPHPPQPPLPGRLTIATENRAPLAHSMMRNSEQFEVTNNSAGYGVPRRAPGPRSLRGTTATVGNFERTCVRG